MTEVLSAIGFCAVFGALLGLAASRIMAPVPVRYRKSYGEDPTK